MAKKNARPSTTTSSPAAPRARRPPAAKKPAAAPVDVATVAGTEPIESAAERASLSAADDGDSPSTDEIAQAAYQRYLSRGGQHGADFDDWIEAERELRQRRSR
jgi:hypothetical protein